MKARAYTTALLVAAAAVGCAPVAPLPPSPTRAGGANGFVNMAVVRASLAALPDLRLTQAEVCALTDAPDFHQPPLVLLAPGGAQDASRLARPEEIAQVAPVIHCKPNRPALTVSAQVTCDANRPVCSFSLVSGGVAIPPFDRTYWFARRQDGSLHMVASVISVPPWTPRRVANAPAAAPTAAVDGDESELYPTTGGVVGGVIGGSLGGPTVLSNGRTVVPFGAGMNRPTRISGREIQYTVEARQAGVQGVALVKCIINVDGALSDCKIIKGLPQMDAEILAAVSTWKMTPVLFNGAPVSVSYTIPIRLVLSGSPGWSILAPGAPVLPFAAGMNRPSKLSGRLPNAPVAEAGSRSSGVVRARCTIGPEGNLLACALTQEMPGANAEVLEALKAWRMTPVLRDGKPVTVTYQFEFVFGSPTLPPLPDGTSRFSASP